MAAPRPQQVHYACLGQPAAPQPIVLRQMGSQPIALQPLPSMAGAALTSQPIIAGQVPAPGSAPQVAAFPPQVPYHHHQLGPQHPPAPVQLQPPPVQLPQMVSREVQNELAAKEKQLNDLTTYAETLQQQLQEQQEAHAEREREREQKEREVREQKELAAASRSPAVPPPGSSQEEKELEEMRQQFAAMAVEGQAIRDDIARAAELAQQLNAWFEANASKMRVQDGWTSPSAYVESSTKELKEQMEAVMPLWIQVQDILALEDPGQGSVPPSASGGPMLPETTWEFSNPSDGAAASSPLAGTIAFGAGGGDAQACPHVLARPYGGRDSSSRQQL